MSLTRRDLLKTSAAAGLSLFTFPRLGHADPPSYEGPYLAVFNADGGWDTTYLMDPKGTPDLNRLYTADQILTTGQHRYAPTQAHIAEGMMSNETFFERYGAELVVVNGIDTSVNNHAPCSRYVATGELDSRRYPTLPALMAAAKAPEAPLAFLTFGQYSATGDLIAQSRVPYLRSLTSLASSDFTDSTRVRRYHHLDTESQIEQTLAAARAVQHPLPKVERSRSFVQRAQQSSKTLDAIVPFITPSAPSDLYLQQVEIALAAFASGLGVSANLTLGGFDSHNTNDPDQLDKIPRLLMGVDYMLTRATEMGIRDQLVIVIQSEMGRTPWYNSTGGKDHWSVTSMMALGPGITGDRVIGGTQIDAESGHEQSPRLIEPSTLSVSDEGIRVRPEHIQRALREALGFADHPLAARFPLKVPEAERLVGLFHS